MKVLVTGANGFLGSWLTRHLLDKGLEVKILRRANSDISELKDLPVEHCIGDITDLQSIEQACQGVDTVFHLAGLIAYTTAQRSLMEKVNVGGTKNIVSAVVKSNVSRLVHMSSVTAIGASFDGEPLNEESIYNISDLYLGYFETKRTAENIVKKAVDDQLIDAVILNPSTIYGPGDMKKASRKTQLKVAKGSFPFYTSGGVNIIYVEDAVAAIFTAWKEGLSGRRYILGGENITIKRLFQIIAAEAGVPAPKFYLPNSVVHLIGKFGDLAEKKGKKGPITSENAWTSTLFHWFDSTRAQEELGLKTTTARNSIRKSLEWGKTNGYL